jgi:hypothetical protein
MLVDIVPSVNFRQSKSQCLELGFGRCDLAVPGIQVAQLPKRRQDLNAVLVLTAR